MTLTDDAGLKLLGLLSDLAADRSWGAAWGALLTGSPAGATALAEWIAQQPADRRAELCRVFTGQELYPPEPPMPQHRNRLN